MVKQRTLCVGKAGLICSLKRTDTHKMFNRIIVASFISLSITVMAQTKKGEVYAYWGYNRAAFANSDIRFTGPGYDFTLANVAAHDRPTDFSFSEYFEATTLWIPQYVYRIGYFVTDRWSVSLGLDHMKYIATQNQRVAIFGNIDGYAPFDGVYTGEEIEMTESFLTFEHTDGLNYLNLSAERHFTLFALESGKFYVDLLAGGGLGPVIPKSNVMLFGEDRSDRFHVAGFGLSGNAGVHVGFFRHFFFRTQLKAGYIALPDVLTKPSGFTDRASQHIWFDSWDFAFGVQWSF